MGGPKIGFVRTGSRWSKRQRQQCVLSPLLLKISFAEVLIVVKKMRLQIADRSSGSDPIHRDVLKIIKLFARSAHKI